MPFILIAIGIALVIVGWRGTHEDLVELIKDDFTGKDGFLVWFLSLFLIGLIGYVGPLREISRALIVLVAISMLIANRGLFDKMQQQFKG